MEVSRARNAPNRLEAIRLAQQRISELEQEISVLQQKEDVTSATEFPQKLSKLMKKHKLSTQEVIALLLVRGNLDQRYAVFETVIGLRYILALKELEASRGSEKSFRLRG